MRGINSTQTLTRGSGLTAITTALVLLAWRLPAVAMEGRSLSVGRRIYPEMCTHVVVEHGFKADTELRDGKAIRRIF